MNLTSIVRNLEAELKKAEELTRHHDFHASTLRQKLAEVADALGKSLGVTTVATEAPGGKKRRGMSVAGRARVAAAQRKRWAAHHAKAGVKSVVPKKRRKMSASHKKAIVAAQKVRWAKFRAGKKGK